MGFTKGSRELYGVGVRLELPPLITIALYPEGMLHLMTAVEKYILVCCPTIGHSGVWWMWNPRERCSHTLSWVAQQVFVLFRGNISSRPTQIPSHYIQSFGQNRSSNWLFLVLGCLKFGHGGLWEIFFNHLWIPFYHFCHITFDSYRKIIAAIQGNVGKGRQDCPEMAREYCYKNGETSAGTTDI